MTLLGPNVFLLVHILIYRKGLNLLCKISRSMILFLFLLSFIIFLFDLNLFFLIFFLFVVDFVIH